MHPRQPRSAVRARRPARPLAAALVASLSACLAATGDSATYSWRYYRPTNTGIQGDYCDAIWIGPDGDPWIGGYVPSFEEGGIAKFIQAESRWINISNVDYPVIGHPDHTGVARVSDIVVDSSGVMWMGTGRGALRFEPALGPASLVRYDASNSGLPGGWTTGVELASDGTVWFSAYGTAWGAGGLRRFQPATNSWTAFAGYGDGALAVQPKPAGGYYVWATKTATGQIARYDSATQAWTSYSDCRRPDGTWIGPPVPALPAVSPPIWAFRAFGNQEALLVDGASRTWRFDGELWHDLGIWREGAYTEDVDIDANGNVWVCGTGGAARRDAETGAWQRYRVTNSSQYDFFNNDVVIDQASGAVYACANAGTGYGGMVIFDGVRWKGVNNATYGLGIPWPFPTDNSEAVGLRTSLGSGVFAVNPMFNGIRQYSGTAWSTLLTGATSHGLVEDSFGRLWSIGEYFDLRYFNGSSWTSVPIACWGANIQRDADRPGTVWACANCEVVRSDGVYRWSRQNTELPGLNPQSDVLTTVAAGRDGMAWVGSTKGVHRLNAENNQVVHFPPGTPWLQGGIQIEPRAVTPDGRVWFTDFGSGGNPSSGLGWYDGSEYGLFPGPNPSGSPQWGGLPHAQIAALQVRELADGYELWMSCLSRGLAVLTVRYPTPGDLDGDGSVGASDLAILLGAWGSCTSSCPADLDGNGAVGAGDLAILLGAWS